MSNLKMGVEVDTRHALASLRTLDKGLGGIGKTWNNVSNTIAKSTGLLKENAKSSDMSSKALAVLGAKVFIAVTAFVALSKALVGASKDAIEFQNDMLKIQALTGATADEMDGLATSIRDVAKASIFTAKEVSKASETLAKMGTKAEDQAMVLSNVTALATGTQEDLASTTEIVTKVMNAYNAEADQMGRITDIVASAVSGSALHMQSYGAGMQYLAGQGKSVNLTLEETSSHLALLVDRGQNAQRASRLLSTIYVDMADDSSTLNMALEASGIHLDTVSEKMEWLAKSGMDATTANELFTSGVARMATIMASTGDDFDKMYASIVDSVGISQEMERIQLTGLANSWKIIQSLVHDTSITIGQMLAPLSEAVVQGGYFSEYMGDTVLRTGGLLELFELINITIEEMANGFGVVDAGVEGVATTTDFLLTTFNTIVAVIGSAGIAISMLGKLAINSIETVAGVFGELAGGVYAFFTGDFAYAKDTGKRIGTMISEGFDEGLDIVADSGMGIERLWSNDRKSTETPDATGRRVGRELGEGFTLELGNALDEGLDGKNGGYGGKKVRPHWLDMNIRMSEDLQRTVNIFVDIFQEGSDEILSIMGNVSTMQQNRYQADIDAYKDAENKKINASTMSSRHRIQEEERVAREVEKLEAEANEKKKKWAIADARISGAQGHINAWASAMKYPFPMSTIVGGTMSALIATNTATSVAMINSQNFANGGIVQGEGNGATGGTDNVMVEAREGEMFLNGREQKALFNAIESGELGGGNVYIENFSGSQDDYDRFEKLYRDLRNSGRI